MHNQRGEGHVAEGSSPLRRRSCYNIRHCCFRIKDTLLEKYGHSCVIEEMVPLPAELNVEVVSLERDEDVPEVFRHEVFDFSVLIDHETERRELARACIALSVGCKAGGELRFTVADNLLCTGFELALQGGCLKARQGCSDSKI